MTKPASKQKVLQAKFPEMHQKLQALTDHLQDRLSRADAHPQLAVLGIVVGVVTGLFILLFRAAIEWPQQWLWPHRQVEVFEALSLPWRISLVLLATLVLYGLFFRRKPEHLQTGITHVQQRLAKHQGNMPIPNLVIQFLGGIASLLGGLPVGREGPAVHIGASAGSLAGRWLQLPNNSIRILVACGAAGAIGASFNTPIAGVIFALEVIAMEFHLAAFAPVMLSSVTATLINRLVYGDAVAFNLPTLNLTEWRELPLLVLLAVICAAGAALFTRVTLLSAQLANRLSLELRMLCLLAMLLPVAWLAPVAMGVSYDSVNDLLHGNLLLSSVLMLLVVKTLVSPMVVGLGVPGGLIGPCMVIGACIGTLVGFSSSLLFSSLSPDPAFYALLGMAAVMGGSLHAPLSALMAVMELSANTHVLLPAMLVIVLSHLLVQSVFKLPPLFSGLLAARGIDLSVNPALQHLSHKAVGSIMDRSVIRVERVLSLKSAQTLLSHQATWVIIMDGQKPMAVFPASDLAGWIASQLQDKPPETEIDLMQIPAGRRELETIPQQATLLEALEKLNAGHIDALCVTSQPSAGIVRVLGILTRADLSRVYEL